MNKKQFTAEQIIVFLQQADVKLSQCKNLAQICREIGITEQSYYRCRRDYGELKATRLKGLKEI
jgi:putative transposase